MGSCEIRNEILSNDEELLHVCGIGGGESTIILSRGRGCLVLSTDGKDGISTLLFWRMILGIRSIYILMI